MLVSDQDLPIAGCLGSENLNRPAPSLHRLSAVSSLLRASPPPLLHTTLLYACLLLSSQDSSDFSCSLQTPVMPSCQLYPGCYMTTKQVTRHTFVVNTSVYAHFQHHLIALTRLQSLVQVLQLSTTHLQRSSLRFSLSFTTKGVSAQSSIRRFADYPCRSSAEGQLLLFFPLLPVIQFARTPRLQTEKNKRLPSFVEHSLQSTSGAIQDTHGCGALYRESGAAPLVMWPCRPGTRRRFLLQYPTSFP
jgi:hypothetical protein